MRKILFLIILTFCHALSLFAYDIAVENADGKMIYYNYINNGTELEVTLRSYIYGGYSGSVVIPEVVNTNNRTRKVTRIGDDAFLDCSFLTTIIIPQSVSSIGLKSFYGCSSLTSVVIPDNVLSIDNEAFENCTGLTSIELGNSLENIGAFSFYNCSRLTSLTIPNSVKTIESKAFNNCSSLTTLVIGSSVNNLNKAFLGCSSLTTITSLNASPPIRAGFDNIVYNSAILYIPQGRKTSYINASGWGRFSLIKENSTFINSIIEVDGFYYNITSSDNRTVGVLPKGNDNYSGGYRGDVVIPQTVNYNETLYRVTSIGENAFYGCLDLISVTIPESVTLIDHWAFENCFNLTSVTLPNSVVSIEYWAFGCCKSLSSISLGNNIKYIGREAFYKCTNLTSITIPNSIVSISNSAFSGCNGLSTVILHCKDIGRWFDNVRKLFLGNIVTSIEDYAFYTSDILEVISEIEEPFNLVERTFSYETYTNATLYVPKGTIDKYKATEGWKKFFNIVEGSPSGISIIENEGVKELKRYTLYGRVITDSHKGFNIIQMKNGTTKKVLSK